MFANPYKPSGAASLRDEKAAHTKPPFLRTMVVLIVFNTCLAATLGYVWTPSSIWKNPEQKIIGLVAVFCYGLMFVGAYLLYRRSRYAYIPLLIHSSYAIIIYATSFSSLVDIAMAIARYSALIGSNARVDQALEYLTFCVYGLVMCFMYLGYSLYWRKKGLLN